MLNSLKTISRPCWWCGTRLMQSGHQEVKVHDGTVWVHRLCVDGVREYMRQLTARPKGNWVDGIDWSKH